MIAGAPEMSTLEQAKADWEQAEAHLKELRQLAAAEAQALIVKLQKESDVPDSQEQIDTLAFTHYNRRVFGNDKTDWSEAKQQLKLRAGDRAMNTLQDLGFSQHELLELGKMEDKAAMMKKINERNASLGFPLWNDDMATRRFVGSGIREARRVEDDHNIKRAKYAEALVDALMRKKIGEEGLKKLLKQNINKEELIKLEGDLDAKALFIKQRGWQDDTETFVYVNCLIEAAKMN